MQEARDKDPFKTAFADHVPEDIELDEAGRNWVHLHGTGRVERSLRQVAADAAVTCAIGHAYGQE